MTPSESIQGPAYRIITQRLVIRCPQPSDASLLDDAIKQSLDHLLPWLIWAKREPVSFQERIEYLRKVRGNFDLGVDYGYLIFNLSESRILGGTGLHTRLGQEAREIGYWIHKNHINLGFATEVSAALTKVAFVIDHVRRVEIHCDPLNMRSASVAKKLGFINEATLHNRLENTAGDLRDSMIWTLFEGNYPTSLAAQADIQVFDVVGRRII
jgi:RimJ/RimL family protein N-acetyltransferase